MSERVCGGHCTRPLRECVCVSVFVATDAGRCEEQFQMVTIPLRETETEGEKGKTSQKGSRAAQTEIEEQRAGNAKLTLTHTLLNKPQLPKTMERTGYCVL